MSRELMIATQETAHYANQTLYTVITRSTRLSDLYEIVSGAYINHDSGAIEDISDFIVTVIKHLMNNDTCNLIIVFKP